MKPSIQAVPFLSIQLPIISIMLTSKYTMFMLEPVGNKWVKEKLRKPVENCAGFYYNYN